MKCYCDCLCCAHNRYFGILDFFFILLPFLEDPVKSSESVAENFRFDLQDYNWDLDKSESVKVKGLFF